MAAAGPRPEARIGAGEWAFVSLWTLALLLVIAAPYWHGYWTAGPGWRFSGFVGAYHNDYSGYLAWMRQARDGHLLFKDYYTTEPHHRVFLHPVFWLMGSLARLSGAELMHVWHAVQALACVLLIVTVYRFSAHFTGDVMVRALGLLLVTTAAGWGWLTSPPDTAPWIEHAADLWMAEANAFRAMATSFFTLPLALTFMLLAFLHALRHFRTGRVREAVWSGLHALALAATHQYDMVTLYGVLGSYALLGARQGLKGLAIVAAISLPFCLYSVGVVRLDPVFSIHTQAALPRPTVEACVVGWGAPLVLGLVALAVPLVRRQGRDVSFLATWLVVGVVLLGLPIGFQRKLLWGLHVPMCLLAAMAVVPALRALGRASRPRLARGLVLAGMLAVTASCAVGNALLYPSLFERNALHEIDDYLPDEYVDALRWLDEQADREDVVLASVSIAPLVPGWTGRVVFAGHWAQTVDVGAKFEFVSALFGPPGALDLALIRRVFARNRVRYVMLSSVDRESEEMPPAGGAFAFSPLAERVLDNAFVTIWRVVGVPAEGPAAWQSGDWRGPSDGP